MSKNTPAFSASGQVIAPGAGTVRRILVGTHSSAVIRLIDSPNNAVGRVMLADFPVPAGAQVLTVDLDYSTGVNFVLVSGTGTFQITNDPTIN